MLTSRRSSAILDRCSDLDWNRWHATLFISLRLHLSTLETKRFQKSSFLKPFSRISVAIVLVWTIGENVSKVCVFKRKCISEDGEKRARIVDFTIDDQLNSTL